MGTMHPIQKKLLSLAENKDINTLTLREMAEAIGEEPSAQRIKHHLLQLEKRGLLVYDRGSRTYRLGGVPDSTFTVIPIVGSANAGPAQIFAEENIEGYLKVSRRLVKAQKKLFALRVVGDSMNEAKVGSAKLPLEDGDYAVVEPTEGKPQPNQYVVSVIDDAANIKRYQEVDGNVVLTSESRRPYAPIVIHPDDHPEYLINGVVTDVIKMPQS